MATAGVEIFNGGGVKTFDAIAAAASIIGQFTTNGQKSGSFVDGNLIGRRIIHFSPNNLSQYGGVLVTLNAGNGQVTWTYEVSTSGGATPPATWPTETYYYGAY